MTFTRAQREANAGVSPLFPMPSVIIDDEDEHTRREVEALRDALELSAAEVARRTSIAASTYSEFMARKYKGNSGPILEKLQKWIKAEVARMETSTATLPDIGFVETTMAKQMITALGFAQSRPSMVLLTLGSGLGKTMTLNWYAAHHAHAYRIVIEPIEGRAHPAIRKIAAAFDIRMHQTSNLIAEIKRRLRREDGHQPLLMIDEAQNLTDDAVNQMRFLLDEAGCGLALAGNEDLMSRYALSASREGYGQIHRRIFMRVHHKTAPAADIDLLLDRYSITDDAVRRCCHQIGVRAGGLGQIVDTLHLASISAYGAERAMTADDVRRAWSNRSREVIK